jgi:hypothetical protein
MITVTTDVVSLISTRARCTTLCDKVCQWLPPVSSTYKTDCHDIAEILLKGEVKTIKQTECRFKNKLLICLRYFLL